jgi:hypothetical protein
MMRKTPPGRSWLAMLPLGHEAPEYRPSFFIFLQSLQENIPRAGGSHDNNFTFRK